MIRQQEVFHIKKRVDVLTLRFYKKEPDWVASLLYLQMFNGWQEREWAWINFMANYLCSLVQHA